MGSALRHNCARQTATAARKENFPEMDSLRESRDRGRANHKPILNRTAIISALVLGKDVTGGQRPSSLIRAHAGICGSESPAETRGRGKPARVPVGLPCARPTRAYSRNSGAD